MSRPLLHSARIHRPTTKAHAGSAAFAPHQPGEPAADFVVQGPAEHGIPGLVQLYGIESPGLTSALVLADYVARLVDRGFRG